MTDNNILFPMISSANYILIWFFGYSSGATDKVELEGIINKILLRIGLVLFLHALNLKVIKNSLSLMKFYYN